MRSKKKQIKFSFWQTLVFVLGAVLLTIWGMRGLGDLSNLGNLGNLGNLRKGAAEISAAELKNALEKKARLPDGQDFTFINVHAPYEGEIAKTDAFIAFDKIEENKDKLPKDKNSKIILYCQTGKMSETAVKKLTDLGFTNVSYLKGGMEGWIKTGNKTFNVEELKKLVLPEGGFAAPVKWGNLGPTLVSLGVIDLEKFKQAVRPKEEQLAILEKETEAPIRIDKNNAQFVVDVLWALGLAQKSKVYEEGPMGPTSSADWRTSRGKKNYREWVGNFASTGGWTLAKRNAVDYLGKHEIVKLTENQQERVYQISQNIFRPCCGNPTSFPDCNHGMAALGLVELMVAQGFSDEEIYKTVLGFNSFWFPQSYLATAAHFALEGTAWKEVEAKKALGQDFSSGQGAAKISQEIGSLPYLYGSQGGGCGV